MLALLVIGAPIDAALTRDLHRSADVGGRPPSAALGTSVVLYDQFDAPSGNGSPDQNFETALDAFDSVAADDFIVPIDATWIVHEIRTVGSTTLSGGATVSVSFHHNVSGGGNPDLPGAAVPGCSYSEISPTSDTSGSYVIRFAQTCLLTADRYWLQVQTRQDLGTHGQHFWSTRANQTGSEAVWRNPGNGFGSGCVAFRPQRQCGVGGGASPDLLFQIVGEEAGADLAVTIADTPDPVVAGESVQYLIEVRNQGPAPARDIELQLALHAAVAPQNATASHGGVCSVSVNSVLCRWAGQAASNALRTVSIDARVPAVNAHGTTIRADASVSAASDDPESGNNAAVALTAVSAVADLSLSIAASPDPVLAGTGWIVAADIANEGPSDAEAVRLVLSVPPGTSVAHADPGPGGTCSVTSELQCNWTGGTGGGSGRRLVAALNVAPSVVAGTQLTSVASATSPTMDDDLNNNIASVRSSVQTSADLQISLLAEFTSLPVGTVGEIRATAYNPGASDAQAVEVEIALGAALRVAGVDADGAECLLPQIGLGGTVRCRWPGATEPQTSRELRVRASSSNDGQIEVTAVTRSLTADPDSTNNRAATNITVTARVHEVPLFGVTWKLMMCLLLVVLALRQDRI